MLTSFIVLIRVPIALLESAQRRVVVVNQLVEEISCVVRRELSAISTRDWGVGSDQVHERNGRYAHGVGVGASIRESGAGELREESKGSSQKRELPQAGAYGHLFKTKDWTQKGQGDSNERLLWTSEAFI